MSIDGRCLQQGDLGEYNQCQSQLMQLYPLGIAGNVDEFMGYRILYFLFTLNRSGEYVFPSGSRVIIPLF